MTTHSSTMNAILSARLIAIFRGNYQGRWADYGAALVAGGVTVMEVTLNSPDALLGIRALHEAVGDRAIIGAGTVLTTEEVGAAVEAGASFIVAPDTDEYVIKACIARNLPVIPGAFTPSEIKRAHAMGASLIKVFPSQSPAYLRAIRAPLAHIQLLATGGVNLSNAREYLEAGVACLGIGSDLTGDKLTPTEVTARAAEYIALLATFN